MAQWQHLDSHIISTENGAAALLLLLAVLLIAPAIRAFSPSRSQDAQRLVQQRVQAVQHIARTERQYYLVRFVPGTNRVMVLRWITSGNGEMARTEIVTDYSGETTGTAIIEETSLPRHMLTISKSGLPLSDGTITLRDADGSRCIFEVGR